MQHQYIVFGLDIDCDTLIEYHTDSLGSALNLADVHSGYGYKARVWDNVRRCFI